MCPRPVILAKKLDRFLVLNRWGLLSFLVSSLIPLSPLHLSPIAHTQAHAHTHARAHTRERTHTHSLEARVFPRVPRGAARCRVLRAGPGHSPRPRCRKSASSLVPPSNKSFSHVLRLMRDTRKEVTCDLCPGNDQRSRPHTKNLTPLFQS